MIDLVISLFHARFIFCQSRFLPTWDDLGEHWVDLPFLSPWILFGLTTVLEILPILNVFFYVSPPETPLKMQIPSGDREH